ncbi:MAG: DNA internalization-related competence protein ComEC/Rec2 [candidate division KSB1 bacterium]|nr:DNA internalization-related competence protein ComEC/Rec2 [candidate division KSB1 bacterium]
MAAIKCIANSGAIDEESCSFKSIINLFAKTISFALLAYSYMKAFIYSLQNRPAFKLAILLIAGSIIGYYFDLPRTISLFILFTALIAAILGLCGKVSLLNLCLILAAIAAGLFRYELATGTMPPDHISYFVDSGETVTLDGTVNAFPQYRGRRLEFEFAVRQIDWQGRLRPVHGNILVRLWRMNLAVNYRDHLHITGKLQMPRGERNPGEFNYQKFLLSHGIFGIMDISKPDAVTILPSEQSISIASVVSFSKAKFYKTLHELYPGQAGALIKALLLGERGEIDPELNQAFSRCGVIHALAISGLHVGFVATIFFVLFSLLRFNHAGKIIAMLISLFCYNLIIGFEPPIVRASVMLGIFLIGRLLQRNCDALNAISMAAIIILLIHPMDLFQASFQLSFAATLAIVFLYRRLKNIFDKIPGFTKLMNYRGGNYLGSLFLVSFAAQLGTLPITVYYFGRFSIIGTLLNLIVIPMVGIIIALGLASSMIGLFSLSIARLYATANMLFLDKLIQLVDAVGKWKFSAVEVGAISIVIVAASYGFLWIILNLDREVYRKALVYVSLGGLLFLVWQPILKDKKWLEVIYFDVGQGDAALICFPSGKKLLIDGGPAQEEFDSGESIIVPYLKRHRINRLDAVVVSHADNDHIGGVASVLQAISVNQVFDNGLLNASAICSTYQEIIKKQGREHQVARAGQVLPGFENCVISFLHPTERWVRCWRDDINNCSVVAKITYGQKSFIFPGDIGHDAEAWLIHYGPLLKADVLKIAHHGSRTSSSAAWLRMVQPEYAVISVGKNNKFKFPAPSILRRLDQFGIKTVRTDVNGAVVFRTDGMSLERVR